MQILTGNNGAPLTHTLSAKRTRLGLDRSLARLPADSSVDLRPGQLLLAGWHTSKFTCVSHARTNCMTWSLGASLTSSPFTANMRSPGSSCGHKQNTQQSRCGFKSMIGLNKPKQKQKTKLNRRFNVYTLSTLGPPSVTNRTITGRSLPATKPKPIMALRVSVTRRGSGGLSSWR